MSGPFRHTDAVLTIKQDNKRRAIEVTSANDAALELVEYPAQELIGQPLSQLLPEKISEMLDDYVEYAAGANDAGDVLRKVRDFQLLNKSGKSLPIKLKILRNYSQEFDEFLLVLQNESHLRGENSIIAQLRRIYDAEASLDPNSNLPDRSCFERGVELVLRHHSDIPVGVCLAVVEVDNYEHIAASYGQEAAHKAVHDIAMLCRQNLRGNDAVSQVNAKQIGLILVGTTREPVKMVLNRLRWLIAGANLRIANDIDVNSSVSILFRELLPNDSSDAVLAAFEQMLVDKPADSTNLVEEI